MKKLLIIAVVSSFIFISCSKDAPTQPATKQATQPSVQPTAQPTVVTGANVNPGPPAPLSAQQFVITNVETNWGFAPYEIRFRNANTGQFQTVTLNMGQSITVCMQNVTDFTTNFAYTILAIGNC